MMSGQIVTIEKLPRIFSLSDNLVTITGLLCQLAEADPNTFNLMNDLSENLPADELQSQLEAAKAEFKQAKEAVKAARQAASLAKEKLRSLKADLKKAAAKKPKKSKKTD